MHRSISIRIAAAAGAVTMAALVLLVAAPAQAHNYLVDSSPTEAATLTELPSEFSVSTNDTLLDLAGDGGGFAIQVTDSHQQYFGDGCFTIRDETLSTPAALGAPGDYLMRWQLVSADGHTISGEIAFVWQPDANQTISSGLDAPPACGGGTLDASPKNTAGDQGIGDNNQVQTTSPATVFDASTVVLIAAAAALVLSAAVAIFLISVRRNKNRS